ncbi:bacteriohemerythrin [Colwellia sp. MSW7]|uniref:Bacteriohemerythrin n=1 Tax=Colwellia maritima TaxID=2912588 RepID=A0ABS9X3J0_9GAMM|nr:bacteriohemerythrin [Colwellia maritima]MCI2284808.1 bacteriohemerythrin [Colwellia maritima]
MRVLNQPDVIMVYQDRDVVEPAIKQIMELELDFKAYKHNPKRMQEIAKLAPKVLLLSSNDVKNTIQFYIDYLEEYEQNIAPHSAVLLINNRETLNAYLACENGLFDNYVIINPLNEPYRLKPVLLQELKIIDSHKNNSLDILISEGDDQLASCIEHGVALKKSFIHEVNKCGETLLSATNDSFAGIEGMEAKTVLQNLIGLSLDEMNENISSEIQNILTQLNQLKLNNDKIKQSVNKHNTQSNKTIVGVNAELLTSTEEKDLPLITSRYKVLIAEPSDLFTRVIEAIFSETVFKYLLVNDGKSALSQIAKFQPDVVLLAYDLPNVNGIDVTKTIRKKGNKVPIIAYANHVEKAVMKEWIEQGLSGYLLKPLKKSAILASVNYAVKNPEDVLTYDESFGQSEIHWDAEYAVGNADMDNQHKELFDMINEFFKQDNKQSAIILFESLSSYIDLHFESEENLLRQINYPATDEHIKQHEELRHNFNALRNRLIHYDIDIQHKIGMFLYNWMAKHILQSDMEYKAYALSIEEDSFMPEK